MTWEITTSCQGYMILIYIAHSAALGDLYAVLLGGALCPAARMPIMVLEVFPWKLQNHETMSLLVTRHWRCHIVMCDGDPN